MAFWDCGVEAGCSGVALATLALASCCFACAAFSSKQNFFLFFLGFVYIRRPFYILPYVLAGVLVQVQVFRVLFL